MRKRKSVNKTKPKSRQIMILLGDAELHRMIREAAKKSGRMIKDEAARRLWSTFHNRNWELEYLQNEIKAAIRIRDETPDRAAIQGKAERMPKKEGEEGRAAPIKSEETKPIAPRAVEPELAAEEIA